MMEKKKQKVYLLPGWMSLFFTVSSSFCLFCFIVFLERTAMQRY